MKIPPKIFQNSKWHIQTACVPDETQNIQIIIILDKEKQQIVSLDELEAANVRLKYDNDVHNWRLFLLFSGTWWAKF